MKYKYELFYDEIYVRDDPFLGPIFDKHCIGGSFMPCSGSREENFLRLSPDEVVEKYKDKAHACALYMSNFMSNGDVVKTGYIGEWDPEIDDQVKLYYIITENGPCKMFIVKFNGLSFSNPLGVQYVTCIDGKMMDCYPEEGDILFDNLEDAEAYYKKNYLDRLKK